jgi:chromate reductase, NAD(P)H dehydrogenase (quinone)
MQIKILTFCGSSRRDSLNQKLLDTAVLGALAAGAQVSNIRLLDFPLPIYDADWETEHGLPDCARTLKALIAEHHALLIATPEHNGGYPALLKNALDWASRPSESDPTGLEVFAGKVAAVLSASPGAMGGMRAQIALQISLNKIGLLVIPNSFALGLAHQAFDEQSCLKDGNAHRNVRGVGAALVRTAIAVTQGSSIPMDEDSGMAIPSGFSNSFIYTQHGAESEGLQSPR